MGDIDINPIELYNIVKQIKLIEEEIAILYDKIKDININILSPDTWYAYDLVVSTISNVKEYQIKELYARINKIKSIIEKNDAEVAILFNYLGKLENDSDFFEYSEEDDVLSHTNESDFFDVNSFEYFGDFEGSIQRVDSDEIVTERNSYEQNIFDN